MVTLHAVDWLSDPAAWSALAALLTLEIVLGLQEDGIAVVMPTRIDGRLALRAAITNHRSRPEDFELVAREVARRGRHLLGAAVSD